MKYPHLILFLFCLGHAFAQDSVDQLSKKYTDQAQEGLIRLHSRHREELVKIQNAAMELKDLTLANKANAKIKELDDEIRKLGGTPPEPKPDINTLDKSHQQIDLMIIGTWIFIHKDQPREFVFAKDRSFKGQYLAKGSLGGKWETKGDDILLRNSKGQLYPLKLKMLSNNEMGYVGEYESAVGKRK
jgi:hypothetical protein